MRRNTIYKPRRGLNDISVLSSSRDGRSLSASRAVNLANAGLIDGLWLGIGRGPLSYATPDCGCPNGIRLRRDR
jgi:hypothetical protein